MEDLVALLALMFAFLLWWHQRGVKDRALRTAHARCAQLGLQLLDETVQLASMRPARDAAGNWAMRRRYRFEFTSTGDVRYVGELELVGLSMTAFELPPYAMPAPADAMDADELVEADEKPPRLH